ncbi:MAG: hypothetical protein LQ340_002457 [Diploschistes diacapsis]|nr:MAG: hypothetical protein LQ340_002457 [Diploschistes diacapsis]
MSPRSSIIQNALATLKMKRAARAEEKTRWASSSRSTSESKRSSPKSGSKPEGAIRDTIVLNTSNGVSKMNRAPKANAPRHGKQQANSLRLKKVPVREESTLLEHEWVVLHTNLAKLHGVKPKPVELKRYRITTHYKMMPQEPTTSSKPGKSKVQATGQKRKRDMENEGPGNKSQRR